MAERHRLAVDGVVQGVGFRPFVYGLARRCGLVGYVRNDSAGVLIEVEGDVAALAEFAHALRTQAPPLARVETVRRDVLPAVGYRSFSIETSRAGAMRRTLVAADTATCDDCLREVLDPGDRRYRHPFTNCTNCGPRFTTVEDVPYDRERTTMSVFPMCPECRSEYEDPENRRFHAQPNACPRCGPKLSLVDTTGRPVEEVDIIAAAARLLSAGAIVAVKGLGGFHLACDATDTEAVSRLRGRKHREHRPFALMAPDLAAVEAICEVDGAERALLLSSRRPIVLLRARERVSIASAVAPGQRYLGVMLPYTPLHHLLLRAVKRVLVMTSGNLSDEPIAHEDADALGRLAGIADYFVMHNRAVHMRCDDSVTRVVAGGERLVRRSRGHVPEPLVLSRPVGRPLLACGAELKNTFCLAKGNRAFLSHHIGDLENYETLRSFTGGIEHFKRLFDIEPEAVAYDLHPRYLSTAYALEQAGLVQIGVQHHHAHVVSCMAEHRLDGPVIGVAFDGTGYGSDSTLWGGEFLIADRVGFRRAGHLRYAPLPGGERAIREPWRMAASWLFQVYGDEMDGIRIPFVDRLRGRPWRAVRQMIERSINCPVTSSVGRLFDAVSSLAGVCDEARYEAQAAIDLEMVAEESAAGYYEFEIQDEDPLVLGVDRTIRGIVEDLEAGESAGRISAKFHSTLAGAIVGMCQRIRADSGISTVVLSGGVFQNALLLRGALEQLTAGGFEVVAPSRVPANDGGIALGQAVIAGARLAEGLGSEPASRRAPGR